MIITMTTNAIANPPPIDPATVAIFDGGWHFVPSELTIYPSMHCVHTPFSAERQNSTSVRFLQTN